MRSRVPSLVLVGHLAQFTDVAPAPPRDRRRVRHALHAVRVVRASALEGPGFARHAFPREPPDANVPSLGMRQPVD